ncbi:MFS transporter [Halanaerobiaceae bacterium Z-7014]|uniref:MFS transporter n=1 Tax=Halonatronomonas betaini TaxID=2778430 RepID=A0A931ANK8_9FIRM|nr:MFS transporter [Halonatronomonas betaini]MBF8435617.1 MFS transporter [Halonatronomonas betaini]
MAEKRLKNIALINKFGYGAGNLGAGIILQVVNTYIVFYATAVLNIPGTMVGIAVSLSIIWDALTDPLMGYISDRTTFKYFGRRHLYLLLGALFAGLFNFYLWTINPEQSLFFKYSWFFANIILVKTFLTVFGTPYVALGAELSSDYNERTLIQSIRTVFFIFGVFSATALVLYIFFKPTEEYHLGQLNPAAYANMGIVSSLVMIISGIIAFISTYKYLPYLYKLSGDKKTISFNPIEEVKQIIIDFKNALNNYDFRSIVLGYLATNLTVALFTAVGLHVFTYTFNMNNTEIAIIIGTQFLISIISQPFWVAVAARFDKRPTILIGLGFSLIAAVIFLFSVFNRAYIAEHHLLLMPFAFFAGFGNGSLFTMPASMVADVIDVEELKTGTRLEGIYFGCLTFSYKTSQSIAILFLGILLDLIGFDPTLAEQPEFTLLFIGLILGIGGIITIGFAFKFYNNYRLTCSIVRNVQEKLRYQEGTNEE